MDMQQEFDIELPNLVRLKQHLEQPQVDDVAAAVRKAIGGSKLPSRLKPGGSVAVAVGSRGIAN